MYESYSYIVCEYIIIIHTIEPEVLARIRFNLWSRPKLLLIASATVLADLNFGGLV